MLYDRPRGELVSIKPFEDSQEALRARFAEEHNHRADPGLEIVVLTGESEDHLRTTHGRYLGQVHDILVQMRKAVLEVGADSCKQAWAAGTPAAAAASISGSPWVSTMMMVSRAVVATRGYKLCL